MVMIKNPITVVSSGGGGDVNYLPYRVSNIENYSYSDNTITNLKRGAFQYDERIVAVDFPNVDIVPVNAFYQCTSLNSVNFSSSLKEINASAFYGCTSLSSINLPDTLVNVGNYVFTNTAIPRNYSGGINYIGNANNQYFITDKIDNVNSNNCVVHSNTKIISGGTFLNCRYLISVTGMDNVVSLGNSAFQNCSQLATITLPKVNLIDANVFSGCGYLAAIYLQSTTVCTLLNANAIPATASHNITIYVPSNLISSYQTATNWSTLYNNGYITFAAIS